MFHLVLICVLSVAIVGVIKFMIWLYSPLFRIGGKLSGGVDRFNYQHTDIKRQVNLLRELKKQGDFLPPYPDGWFRLVCSDQLEAGDVIPVKCLGKDFAVIRTREEGKAHVLDAYCPHLGADMSIGNKVTDDGCLECPFHGWKFRPSDGKCVEIPQHDKKIPDLARINRYPSMEINGQVFVWHHHDPEKADKPDWWLEEQVEFKGITAEDVKQAGVWNNFKCALNGMWSGEKSTKWRFAGRIISEMECHFQELTENGADINHFRQYHETLFPGGVNLQSLRYKIIGYLGKHQWTDFKFVKYSSKKHVVTLQINDSVSLLGKEVDTDAFAMTWLGPSVHCVRRGKSNTVFQHITPIRPGLNSVSTDIYVSPEDFYPYSKLIAMGYIVQFGRDANVLQRKIFKDRGIMIGIDSTLVQFRRWMYQFYNRKYDTKTDVDESMEKNNNINESDTLSNGSTAKLINRVNANCTSE